VYGSTLLGLISDQAGDPRAGRMWCSVSESFQEIRGIREICNLSLAPVDLRHMINFEDTEDDIFNVIRYSIKSLKGFGYPGITCVILCIWMKELERR